jgi:superfamily II DNA or RNA helicase
MSLQLWDKKKVDLRPYQVNIFEKGKKKQKEGKSVVLTMPTGAGKTIVMVALILYWLSLGYKVLIVVNRNELVKQTGKKFTEYGINYTIIQGSKEPDLNCSVAIASIQTLAKRNYDLTSLYTKCVIDECHNAIADSYDKVFTAFPGGRMMGLSATIEVCGKYGKSHKLAGRAKRLRHRFDEVVWEIHPKDLLELGCLVKADVKTYQVAKVKRSAMRVNKMTGDYEVCDALREFNCPEVHDVAIAEWKKLGSYEDGTLKPAFVFCCNVKHAKDMAAYFNEKGIPTVSITGNTPDHVREKAFDDLRSGVIKAICNVGVIIEGFDLPEVCVLIWVRPTLSKTIWIQGCGRGLRPAPGKEKCLIIDLADNCIFLGHHPMDSMNIAAIWAEEDIPRKKVLPGTEFESLEIKDKKEKQERQIVELKFLNDYKDFETRTIDRLVARRDARRQEVAEGRQEKEYKPYWVYVSFVKTCYFPSKASFEQIAKELGYQWQKKWKGQEVWTDHAYRKAMAYNYFVANDKQWKDYIRTPKEADEVKGWAKPPEYTYSSNYSSSGAKSSKQTPKQEVDALNVSPKGDNYYPQLEQVYKREGWEAVRSVFRKLAMKLHPDHNPGISHNKMTNLNLAFEKLSIKTGKF